MPQSVASDRSLDLQSCSFQAHKALTLQIASVSSLELEGCLLHQLEALPALVSFPGSLNFVNCVVLAQSLRPFLPEQGQLSTKAETSLTAKIPPHSSLDLGGRSLHHQEALPGYVASEGSLNVSGSSPLLQELLHLQLQLKPVLVGQTALEARLDRGGYCLHQQEIPPAEPGSPAGLYLDCCCPQALQPLTAQVASQGCLDGNGCACDQLGGSNLEATKPQFFNEASRLLGQT